ncbi:MAG: putative DNA binding domain-containing protein [Tannerella sp.]|jgi:ATP-dependent DNA helicase RecG|nr:putative DNA binding domain-containing protein [Tannerella sp.]
MAEYTAQELFEILNETDECDWIEAKGISDTSHSVMETVCAFSNEPGLDGGYIVMSVSAEDAESLPIQYKVDLIPNPDKSQRDLATQCASMFNLPVRPKITIGKINGLTAMKIRVEELSAKQKPLYFKKDKLPYGAMRRIGSTDQHCTDDDMHVFYQDANSYDQTPVKGTTMADVDENALKRYRTLREKVNSATEELTYSDSELLQALGCVNKENRNELNIAGLLLFGSSKTQRSTFPMLRVDYIRVQGNTWVENPDNRFTTIDMRGPLLLMLYRLLDAINADLPKGFLLPEDDVQAASTGLPIRALREAIINALIHRSYREHRPTQIIRYDNRLEIINPGFSLKPEEKLGLPGSETRNPFIAAVFHDTNLAETKGSGIRTMQKLMVEAHLAPPIFESSRKNNEFVARLLLHHFLDDKDIEWLIQFETFELTDSQKQALIFVREVGAIDNPTYRQMANSDIIKAGTDLRKLKEYELLISKGKGRATYYVPGKGVSTQPPVVNTQPTAVSTQPTAVNTQPTAVSTQPSLEIPKELYNEISKLKRRINDEQKLKQIIRKLCSIKALKSDEIAAVLNKREDYIRRKYLSRMLESKELRYLFPEMLNHPEQAYITNKKD